MSNKIFILDFGAQYSQLIARRVRELHVYSEVIRYNTPAKVIATLRPAGIILSGGPASVYEKRAPLPDPRIFDLGIPILGICYGTQIMAKFLGGKVEKSSRREYGAGLLQITEASSLWGNLPMKLDVWNSHGDHITAVPNGFKTIGQTTNAPCAAMADTTRKFYGIQFHPEVAHTPRGKEILSNFVLNVCDAKPNWTMESFIDKTCREIQETVGKEKVILGLSGGVDSSVAAALLNRAIGKQLHCIFVDNGLLRLNERKQVEELFGKHLKLNLRTIDASKIFLKKLRGVSDPERKRKIIGRTFIEVFESAKKKTTGAKFLGQGTVYPDVIESTSIGDNPSQVIKSHHNVGGLPKKMKFALVEPLRHLFKDEVREVGDKLGLPHEVVWRHPFPGPGLAVRCLGPVDAEKLRILREADHIVIEEMRLSGWYDKVWQAFAVLLPVRSVGVMGDNRTYDYTIAIRIVQSQDGMTANWAKIDHDILGLMSSRITNEVKGVSRVVYDISSKPPATIEWE